MGSSTGSQFQMGTQVDATPYPRLLGALLTASKTYLNDHALAMTFNSMAIEVGRASTETVVLAGRISEKYPA